MKLKPNINNILNVIFVLLGSCFGFVRELIVAYYVGDSELGDVFRMAYSIPNFATQTIGTLLVTILVGYCNNNDIRCIQDRFSEFFRISLILLVVCCSTVGLQIKVFYPFYQSSYENVYSAMMLGWLMFFICSLTFFPRAYLLSINNKFSASSAVFFRNFSFVCVILITSSIGLSISVHVLIFSAIFSSIVLILSHVKGIIAMKDGIISSFPRIFSFDRFWLTILSGALTYQLMSSSPRFIDRAISTSSLGLLSSVEFAYGVISIPLSIITSLALIFIFSQKNRKLLNYHRKWLTLLCITIPLYYTMTYIFFDKLFSLIFDLILSNFSDEGVESVRYILKCMTYSFPMSLFSLLILYDFVSSSKFKVAIFFASVKVVSKLVYIYLFSTAKENYICVGQSYLVSEFFLFVSLLIYKFVGFYHDRYRCRNA